MSVPAGPWYIDDVLTFYQTAHDPTSGGAVDADAPPDYRIYEVETGTAILTGSMALLDSGNTAGLYSESVTLSAANGFEVGKTYVIYREVVVDGVTDTAEESFKVIAVPAGAGLSAQDVRDAMKLAPTPSPAPDEDSIDDTLAEIQAQTDQLTFTVPDLLDVNVKAIADETNAAVMLERHTRILGHFTADAGATTTVIPLKAISPTPSVLNQLRGRVIVFFSDAATGGVRIQASRITASASDGSSLTVSPVLTTAPAEDDEGMIV